MTSLLDTIPEDSVFPVEPGTGGDVPAPQPNPNPTDPDAPVEYPDPGSTLPPGMLPDDPGDVPAPQPVPGSTNDPNNVPNIWEPTGYEDDPMVFDTHAPEPGGVPLFDVYTGDGGPNVVTQNQGEGGEFGGAQQVHGDMARINPDGSIDPGSVSPYNREVQREERTSEQLSDLLRSDSKFIQDARRQGLEQANAVGGLGGTTGVGASMQAAIRSALPIAESDAQAYRQAASENMQALNQFSQMNMQRATNLEQSQIDARTRQQLTQMTNSANMAQAYLQSATQRDLSRADNETRLRLQEMQGQIQSRLADLQYRYTSLLNDQQGRINMGLEQVRGEYTLANTGLAGEFDLEQALLTGQMSMAEVQERLKVEREQQQLQRESTYANLAAYGYDNMLNRIADLNGMEMSDETRASAIASIQESTNNYFSLISGLFPGMDHISMPSLGG